MLGRERRERERERREKENERGGDRDRTSLTSGTVEIIFEIQRTEERKGERGES
jgi:hypothetical protein